MIVVEVTEKAKVLYEQWSEDAAGEPAILMTKYTDSIELRQVDNVILISRHEARAFVRELNKYISGN